MAVIRIDLSGEASVRECSGRETPVKNGSNTEFRDATEEELAFWNVLDNDEKADIAGEAQRRCFFDVLHESMQREAEKARKMSEREAEISAGVERPGTPGAPPSPQGPNPSPVLANKE